MALESKLYECILSNNLLSEAEVEIIRTAVNDIREVTPTDKPLLFRKNEKLIGDSQSLSWVILVLKKKYDEINLEYKRKKDPSYTMLVRQGRPSSAAIEAELRMTDNSLYSNEDMLSLVNNIIEYVQHLELSLDRYMRILNDKLRYN